MAKPAAVDCRELRRNIGLTIDRDTEGAASDSPREPTSDADPEEESSGSLAQLFAAISELWEIDVDEQEMALRFDP